jgi:CTP:molybdopterin cytidylyltransferase MocA
VTRIFAIIPAAGQSRRMGTAKQLLDVGGRPMLLSVLESLAASEVDGIVLVTNSSVAQQLAGYSLSNTGKLGLPMPPIAINDDPKSEMIDSIRIGIAEWRKRQTLREHDGFLVCPADQPGIAMADFNACIAAFRASPDRIVIGTYDGRRGHPIVFPVSLADFVQSSACNAGLNALPRAHPERVIAQPCGSPAVVRDVDTPEDYGKLP